MHGLLKALSAPRSLRAAHTDTDTGWRSVRIDGARAFVDRDGANKRQQDQIEILGDVSIWAEWHVNDIARFKPNVRDFSGDDFVVVQHRDFRAVQRTTNDGDLGDMSVLNRST